MPPGPPHPDHPAPRRPAPERPPSPAPRRCHGFRVTASVSRLARGPPQVCSGSRGGESRGREERSAPMAQAAPTPGRPVIPGGPSAPGRRAAPATPDVFSARTHALANRILPVVLGLVYGYWAAAMNRDAGPITGWNLLFGFVTAFVFAALHTAVLIVAPVCAANCAPPSGPLSRAVPSGSSTARRRSTACCAPWPCRSPSRRGSSRRTSTATTRTRTRRATGCGDLGRSALLSSHSPLPGTGPSAPASRPPSVAPFRRRPVSPFGLSCAAIRSHVRRERSRGGGRGSCLEGCPTMPAAPCRPY